MLSLFKNHHNVAFGRFIGVTTSNTGLLQAKEKKLHDVG
jgi:hypothetical protein